MKVRHPSAKFIEPANKENRSAIFKVCGQHDKRRNLVSKTKFFARRNDAINFYKVDKRRDENVPPL